MVYYNGSRARTIFYRPKGSYNTLVTKLIYNNNQVFPTTGETGSVSLTGTYKNIIVSVKPTTLGGVRINVVLDGTSKGIIETSETNTTSFQVSNVGPPGIGTYKYNIQCPDGFTMTVTRTSPNAVVTLTQEEFYTAKYSITIPITFTR